MGTFIVRDGAGWQVRRIGGRQGKIVRAGRCHIGRRFIFVPAVGYGVQNSF